MRLQMEHEIIHLNVKQADLLHKLNDLFGREFDEIKTYTSSRPDDEYLKSLLSDRSFIALVARLDSEVIGGLVAYELKKFEQQRSEVYLYDLAVSANHRRKGIATGLIRRLQSIAQSLGAWVTFVQADYSDKAAVALYSKLGTREDVLHFDLPFSS